MKKILTLMLAFALFACPVLAEEAAPAPEAFAGYWNAIGMLTDGELTPLTGITSLTIDAAVEYQDGFYAASFKVVQDEGDAWLASPSWNEDTLSFGTVLERGGLVHITWTLLDDGNLCLAYEGGEGMYNIVLEPAEAPTLESVIGTWKLSAYDLEGYVMSTTDECDVIFNEDGTGIYAEFIEGVWTVEGDAVLLDCGGDILTFRINGLSLECSDFGDFIYIFELQ